MEGQILGNRYELIEKIGGGGMAIVYKAKCKLLNRFVAVKVLRSEFTNDEEFVKRFRVEAQSAASLSHPNIVPIYDVGNEGDIYYIVMEYVNGITLKEYIDRNGSLSWEEAVKIEIQICSAIEHAHGNHIVHRDIKPHNILLTRDGIAKVTDFGIARAVSSSTITMVGSTIGSVHYFSPEQARGGFVDEKSDLYSLGITLYEMVTGRVPFDGETPVAVALKHLQIEAREPIEFNTTLPRGVNSIIMKAIKKEQNVRYQAAKEMLDDLRKVLREPEGSFVTSNHSENYPTKRVKTISNEDLGKDEYLIREKNDKNSEKKSDKLTYWLAGITSFIIIAIILIISYKLIIPAITNKNVEFVTENYVGKNINVVKDELTKQGIGVVVNEMFDTKIVAGTIISQNVAEKLPLKRGGFSTIKFDVSKGIEKINIKDFKTMDRILYEKDMSDAGLIVTEREEFSDTIGKDQITRTDPSVDTEVDYGSSLVVYVSKGPEVKKTLVPNLIGMAQSEAIRKLLDANLTLGDIYPQDVSFSGSKIIKQVPVANTEVDERTPVDITFNNNPNQSSVQKILSINLTNESSYGDAIKVVVEAIPSDTGNNTIIFNETKSKSDFPVSVNVKVPSGGSVELNIFLNDLVYKNLTITPDS